MSRLLSAVSVGAALVLAASACSNAGAEGNGENGESENAKQDGGGHGDLYYVLTEQAADQSNTSKLLRWDGSEDGEVETVAETQDAGLFLTATVSSDGAYAVYAEGEQLQMTDLKKDETKTVLDYPETIDGCPTPAFAPGTGHELFVPRGSEVTIHYPEKGKTGATLPIGNCFPQPARAEGADELSFFYIDRDDYSDVGEIKFTTESEKTVNTDLGPKAAEFLGENRLHELSSVSPTGSQICVGGAAPEVSSPWRTGVCQVLLDVATGEVVKDFDGSDFTIRYNGAGAMLQKDDEVSYYPEADDLDEPTETVSEPEELAEAQLLAVTDA